MDYTKTYWSNFSETGKGLNHRVDIKYIFSLSQIEYGIHLARLSVMGQVRK